MNFAGVFSTADGVRLPEQQLGHLDAAGSGRPRRRRSPRRPMAYGMAGELVDGNDLFAVYASPPRGGGSRPRRRGPTLIEALTYRIGPHTTTDDPGRYRTTEEVERVAERDPLDRVRRYLQAQRMRGPRSGRRRSRTTASERIERRRRPTAEGLDRPRRRGDLRRDVRRAPRPLLRRQQSDRGAGDDRAAHLAQALNQALDLALSEDPRVVLLGEDVGRTGGVFRITDGLLERYGEERVIDTPVAESGIVGAAFGMAVAGMRPVVEIQFMGFSYPAFDQVISHVSRIRNRSRHRFTAPMVIRIPYGGGIGAAEHHSESAEAIYVHTPGLKVVVPSTPHDAKGLLLAAIDDPDPVIFLEPIRLYRAVKEEVPDGAYEVPIGRGPASWRTATTSPWSGYGAMMREVRRAADLLAGDGVSARAWSTCAPCHRSTSRPSWRPSAQPGGRWWSTRRPAPPGSAPRSSP